MKHFQICPCVSPEFQFWGDKSTTEDKEARVQTAQKLSKREKERQKEWVECLTDNMLYTHWRFNVNQMNPETVKELNFTFILNFTFTQYVSFVCTVTERMTYDWVPLSCFSYKSNAKEIWSGITISYCQHFSKKTYCRYVCMYVCKPKWCLFIN